MHQHEPEIVDTIATYVMPTTVPTATQQEPPIQMGSWAMTTCRGHYFCYNGDYRNMTIGSNMQEQVSKSQFKAKALELFRQVESSGDAVIVTDHGKPTIEVRRYRKTERSPLEVLKGSVTEYKEPTEAVGEGDWEALA
ncbi:type II toxin-antitoxin system Phd/YefM family antitoxin [Sedimenticola hydrogenitrophicus]|uniref:type II toxin-antitoxin system Phd/YefM family antitoxin n=1 Tax=Sedimenticola hydrogenitrophicus TaxID=2967975 RepID=UPI002FFABB1B